MGGFEDGLAEAIAESSSTPLIERGVNRLRLDADEHEPDEYVDEEEDELDEEDDKEFDFASIKPLPIK